MPITFDKLLVSRCYQTIFGEIRRVTGISQSGEVSYTSFDARGEAEPVDDKQIPGKEFADEVDKEVPCPLGS